MGRSVSWTTRRAPERRTVRDSSGAARGTALPATRTGGTGRRAPRAGPPGSLRPVDDAAERLRDVYEGLAGALVAHPETGVLWRRERRHLTGLRRAGVARVMGRAAGLVVGELRRVRAELSADDAELLAWAGASVLGSVSDHRVPWMCSAPPSPGPPLPRARRGGRARWCRAVDHPPRTAPQGRGTPVPESRLPRGDDGGHRRGRGYRRAEHLQPSAARPSCCRPSPTGSVSGCVRPPAVRRLTSTGRRGRPWTCWSAPTSTPCWTTATSWWGPTSARARTCPAPPRRSCVASSGPTPGTGGPAHRPGRAADLRLRMLSVARSRRRTP